MLGYLNYPAAAWTSWVIGALVVVVGAAALPTAITVHRSMAGQH